MVKFQIPNLELGTWNLEARFATIGTLRREE